MSSLFPKDELETIKHVIFFELKRHYLEKSTTLRYAHGQDTAEQILLKASADKFVISNEGVRLRQNVLRKVLFQLSKGKRKGKG